MVRSTTSLQAEAPFRFDLPDDLAAPAPPEKRGLARDQVRLLAADRRTGALTHTRFDHVGDFLRPGDCLVFNASRTLPASLRARAEMRPVASSAESGSKVPRELPSVVRGSGPAGAAQELQLHIRLARRWDDGVWSALALSPQDEPIQADLTGALLTFGAAEPGNAEVTLDRAAARDPKAGPGNSAVTLPGTMAHGLGPGGPAALAAEVLGRDPLLDRLWKIRFSRRGSALLETLSRLGEPVRYWYAAAPWDLDYYQTIYAREPGSVEMPSAGRAFTWKLLLDLRRRGIGTAFLVLHAGLSSYMDREFDLGHPASTEPFKLDASAAERINACKARGGRIVAVGTTVVRALESIAGEDGKVRAAEGATRLRITPGYDLRIVDGLLTGFHEPEASHLDLLTAFMPPEKLGRIYEAALAEKYLWHEFGDANLIL